MEQEGTLATASSVASGAAASSAPKDRDPAPAFDGDPQMFKQYERDVALWQWESDIPRAKHAVKLLRSLSGTARAAADEVSLDKIKSEEGVTAILEKLREHYQPHLESTMPRAFEKAIYGESRKSRESLQDYVIRMDKGFKELKDEGVELPSIVRGYVMYRQASLTSTQEDQVTTWTSGNFERAEVVRALRKLEKVQREKNGQKHYLMDEGQAAQYDDGTIWDTMEGDDEIENFVYVGEGDLNQVFDEEELHEALATYQEVRKALRDQRTSRGWTPQSKGSGKIGFGSHGKGGFRFGKGSRIHIESLKLRTRCAKCGSIGHWARECTNPPDEHARNRAAAGGQAKGSSSAMSGKSGFVHIGDNMGNHFMTLDVINHLREFPTLGMFLKKVKSDFNSSSSPFCGILTDAERGVVDTAAQSGLIGQHALERLKKSLASHGLKVRETSKRGQARGVGGQAISLGVVELPIGIAGVNGILEATVIQDDVPLLLPVSLLRDLHAQVDLFENQLTLSKFGRRAPMHVMPSGHVTVSVLDFDEAGWKVPPEATALGLTQDQFHLFLLCGPSANVVEDINHPIRYRSPATYHVAMGKAPGDQPIHGASVQPPCRRAGGVQGSDLSALEEGAPAGFPDDLHVSSTARWGRCRDSSGRGTLARRWLVLWMCAAICGGGESASLGDVARAFQQTGVLCRADQERSTTTSAEVFESASGVYGGVCAPSRESGWRWESTSARSVVQVMPQSLEGRDHSQLCGAQEVSRQEDRQRYVQCERYVPTNDDSTEERYVSEEPYVTRSNDTNLGSDGDSKSNEYGNCVQLPEACQALHSEEAGTHSRPSFLQVQPAPVRVLSMGSPGDCPADGSDAARAGGESRGRSSSRGVSEGDTTGGGAGAREQGQRGADDGRAASKGDSSDGGSMQHEPSSTGSCGDHSESCQRQARGDHAEPTSTAPSTGGAVAESTSMDDSSGRRRSSDSGDERLGDAGRVNEEGSGDQARTDAADPGNVGGRLVRERDFTHEEMIENLRHAPWAYELLAGRRDAHTLRSIQLEESYEPIGDRRVPEVWWAKRQDEEIWKCHRGILPNENSLKDMRVIACIAPEVGFEDEEADKVYGTMCRSSRKRLRKALEKVTVSELYSEPRIAAEATKQGLRAGTSIDLKTGFDLTKPGDRQRAWRKLKEEDPDLVMICPPCGPFSQMQAINYSRMEGHKAMAILGEGVEHLEFSMRVFEWQVRRGKIAIFEHPDLSRAWDEECVQRAATLPGVERVRGDQCQFGLRIEPGQDLSLKPTGFLLNSKAIAKRLAKRCAGDHQHLRLEGGHRTKLAERYPPKLCQAIVQGLKDEVEAQRMGTTWLVDLSKESQVWAEEEAEEDELDIEDQIDAEVERSGHPPGRLPGRMIPSPDGGDSEEEEEEEPRSRGVPRGVSEADKRKIKKLHDNLGHPSKEDFVRALKMARAREEVWRYVKTDFKCDLCISHQKPKLNRPAAIPRSYAPGRTVGVDVVFFPGVKPNETIPVLNMTDWGSCYQVLEPLDNTKAEHVWGKFMKSWGRTFGIPEMVVVDQGREFLGAFSSRINEAGAVVKTIGARAPHQQGRTERHGGLAKSMFLRVRDQVTPDSREEWEALVYAVEAAKNRLYNRSGFSPAQRQLGQNIRIPGSLGSDDPFEGTLIRDGAGSEVQKLLQMREAAMEAFIRQTTADAVKRAEKAKTRVRRDLRPGEVVYVYRKPLQRRSIRSPSDTKRAQWVGPGTVVVCEGPNVWVSMRGEVWKCAKEQVRPATMEEEEAYGMLREELEELKEEVRRKGSKRGFKDISHLEHPPEADDDDDDDGDEPPHQRPRLEEGPEGEPPSQQEQEARPEDQPILDSSSNSSSSTTSSSTSQDEPEGERIEEGQLEEAVASVIRNELLDGTTSRAAADNNYGPKRVQLERMRFKPYTGFVINVNDEDQLEDEEEVPTDDCWYFDEERRSLTRWHIQERKGDFVPKASKGCPIDIKHLQSQCQVIQTFEDGRTQLRTQDWRKKNPHPPGPMRFWTGYTEFFLKAGVREEVINQAMLASKSSDEVRDDEITPEEWPEWRKADASEWEKVSSTQAVRALTVEQSEQVMKDLKQQGKLNRILPSRIVRRWKPAEQPGEAPKRKSRWCIRGDKDPDLMFLDRYAPTATTAVISIALQVGASLGFRCALGDLQNAFMQSDPLVREHGKLYCKQPNGGLPGLDPRQIVEILAGAYGLGDAPAHWRRTLKRVLVELGYIQSAMDPCLFKLIVKGKLEGLIVVEVDALLSLGSEVHYQKMKELQSRLKFGKFKFLDEEEDGASFNGRRLRATKEGGFLIDMEKFVTERLKEVSLEKGRAQMKGESANESERNQARATLGALTWAAKEGRPDCAAPASILASTLNRMTIQDILDLNKTVREVKQSYRLTIPIQPIPLEEMQWGVITDASYANAEDGASQGAFGVICYGRELLEKGLGKANLIHWKSSKIQRVVNSTLAAEAQSLSKGLSELAWTVTVFNEMIGANFELKRWDEEIKKRRLHVLTKTNADERLRKSLCVVDAKSLFDHLVKETIGTAADRRTAIEMQVIRQSLAETGAQVKWVPHPRMTMDCLTKRHGNRVPLVEFLDTGCLNFLPERCFRPTSPIATEAQGAHAR
eukprot:s5475_g1.t1